MSESPVQTRKKPIFHQNRPFAQPVFAFIWIWLTFFVSLWLSWHLLAKIDFGYAFWYQYGGIKSNIETYAPQNRYRPGFETTDDAQRQALFHQIAQAIQLPPEQAIKQLKSLRYTTASGQQFSLLRAPEVLHLVDVSHLIQRLNALGRALALIWIGLTTWMLLRKYCFPSRQQTLWMLIGGLGITIVALIAIGPTEVFYQLHHWVFPPEHPWFFYYQDSLMSTMMAAPKLFGQIALLMLFTTLLLFWLVWQIFQRQACIRRQNCG